MLVKYFKILANLFYDCYKCIRMLTNPYECHCESNERVANETTTRHMRIFSYTHCRSIFLFLFARLCPISLFPIILILIVRILALYYENINTNASEALQTSYDYYKCVAIDQNGLRTASEYVANMRLYEFYELVSKIRKISRTAVNVYEYKRMQSDHHATIAICCPITAILCK